MKRCAFCGSVFRETVRECRNCHTRKFKKISDRERRQELKDQKKAAEKIIAL